MVQVLENAVFSDESHVFLGRTALQIQNHFELIRFSNDVHLLFAALLAFFRSTSLFVTWGQWETRCSWKKHTVIEFVALILIDANQHLGDNVT